MQDIVASVQRAKHCLHDAQDKVDLGRVLHFVTSDRFRKVLSLHNKLIGASLERPQRPDDVPSVTSLCDVMLQSRSNNKYASELAKLLGEVHFKVS